MPLGDRPSRAPEDRRIPFGYNKGKRLGDVADDELRSLREWCAERNQEGKFDDLMIALEQVLEDRKGLPLELDDPRAKPRRGDR